jgi:hypothetical protein
MKKHMRLLTENISQMQKSFRKHIHIRMAVSMLVNGEEVLEMVKVK